MNEAPAKQWFAVHTGPKMEFIASRELKRQGMWLFLPFERIRRRRKLPLRDAYRVEWIERPFYPRYLFVHVGHEAIAAINDTVGVSTLVYFAGQPLAIPGRIIDELMERADGDGLMGATDQLARRRWNAGEPVTFPTDSPLAGLVAHIAADLGGKEVKVWLDALGGRREVSVDPKMLRAAGA